MAVPRLGDEICILRLDRDVINDSDEATTISGSAEFGEKVGPKKIIGRTSSVREVLQ